MHSAISYLGTPRINSGNKKNVNLFERQVESDSARLQKGEKVSGVDCETLYNYMDSTRIKRNYGVFKGQPEGFYTIDDLVNEHGLREHILIKKDMHDVKNIAWFDILLSLIHI